MLKKKWIKWAIIGAVVVAAIIIGIVIWSNAKKAKQSASGRRYMTTAAKTGDISVNVTASGNVSAVATKDVTSANDGSVETVNVKAGDSVKKGDVIATLSADTLNQSIQQAETDLQQKNDSLSKTQSSLNITSPATGRIKSINASVGESCDTTVKSYGSLAVISTDGQMKVDVKPSKDFGLQPGDSVNVSVSGINIKGTVTDDSSQQSQGNISGGSLSVVIPRDDLSIGAAAKVYKTDGTYIGQGSLNVNKGISVSGGNGVISKIYVSENQKVSRGSTLFLMSGSSGNTDINSMQSDVQQAQQKLDSLKAQLADNTIKSTIDGVVTALNVQAGDNIQKGKVVATVTDTSKMQMIAAVDELDIEKVKLDQTATVSVDALPDKTLKGTVTNIADIGTASNGVTTYDVTIVLDDSQQLKVGMNASASILVSQKQNVVMVPVEAVQNRNGKKYVMVPGSSSDDMNSQNGYGSKGFRGFAGNMSMKEVQTGVANETYMEITSGLSDGDQVLIAMPQSSSTNSNSNSSFRGLGGMGMGGGGFSGGSRSSGNRSGSGTSNNNNSNNSNNNSSSGNSNNSSKNNSNN